MRAGRLSRRTGASATATARCRSARFVRPDIKRQEGDYIAWLAERRDIDKGKAEEYARSQRRCDMPLESHTEVAGRYREIEACGTVMIRTMRRAGARLHYRPDPDWNEKEWEPARSGLGGTYYAVILGERVINTFLSKPRARQFAQKIAG